MKNLDELANEIHQENVAKGWYEGKPRSPREILMLCISEIAEATEEARNGSPLLYVVDQFKERHSVLKENGKWFTTGGLDVAELNLKPEGEVIEIVDCVIRLLDWAGWKKIDLSMGINLDMVQSLEQSLKDESPLECQFNICASLVLANTEDSMIQKIIEFCFGYVASRGYNLMDLIEMKREYNRTRSHRHGNKLY